jgi:tyrosyl-tRNA synthetase
MQILYNGHARVIGMFFKPKHATVSTDEGKIETLLTRSVAEIITSVDSLKKLLLSGRQLTVKLGIDPTSPYLHIGRAVTLLKLRDFQSLGHKVIFIIGDATGVVGDTSDKEAERPMLTKGEVEENLKSYIGQVTKLLDKDLLEVRHNSEWLLKLDYTQIGNHANAFSVSDFISRDNIKRRLDEGKRVSLREVLYPLMQGYDSVAIKADVELGGVDQRFNLLAGRVLQEKAGQPPQHIVMTELIVGTDGRKMSSSWGNTINLSDAAGDMFGKVMSIPDSLLENYFVHCTRIPLRDVKEVIALHPRDAKMRLAHEIVRMYHNPEDADAAQEGFVNTFSKGAAPANVVEIPVNDAGSVAEALIKYEIVESKTAWRRLLSEGAVKDVATGEKMTENSLVLSLPKTLRIGKHRFVTLVKK